ncbi:AAA family ATPase [Georgenia alba]|uniref:AAA family ATPase n=1 Tax=Georgenia alba TaxID=2233858 RepID=A0ABW2QEV8_9MICO
MNDDPALLVVVAGRPGTGKTTLAGALSARLGATCLRVDAVETALRRAGTDRPGVAGYAVAHELAAANLRLGGHVVVDAVCPVPDSRSAWRTTAEGAQARLVQLVTVLPDPVAHERRVRERAPDLVGQRVPTWEDVVRQPWEPWDSRRDGSAVAVDTTSRDAALAAAWAAVERAVGPQPLRPRGRRT